MPLQGIAHKNLTDPQLHEPKGASGALVGQVAFADGEGHTEWKDITPEDIHVNAETMVEAGRSTITLPTGVNIAALPGTVTGACVLADDFTDANLNDKEIATKLNSLIIGATSMQVTLNNLVTKYNNLLAALKNLGFIDV